MAPIIGFSGAPAGGGGGWTPASASSLFFWFKSDTGVLAAGGGAASNTDPVATWQDQSGNGHHLTQTVSANRPVFETGILNSLPGVHFLSQTPNASFMSNADAVTQNQPFFIMVVLKTASNTTAINLPTIFDNPAGSGNRPRMFLNNGFTDGFCCLETSTGGTQDLTTGVAAANSTAYYFYGGFNGASSIVRFSSGTEQSGSQKADALNTFQFSNDGATPYWGYLLEMFCIPSWTGTDKTNAISYVQTRYGL